MKGLSGRTLAALLMVFFLLVATGCVKHKPVEPEEEDGHVVHRPQEKPKVKKPPNPFIQPYDAEKDKQPPPKKSKLLPRVHVRTVTKTPRPKMLPADEQDLFNQPSPFIKKAKEPQVVGKREELPLDEAFPSQEKVFAVAEGNVPTEVAPLGPGGLVPRDKRPSVKPTKHVVQRGDTLWSIANKYGMTTKELVAANPGVNDANAIAVGMTLYLRKKRVAPAVRVRNKPRYVPPTPRPRQRPRVKPQQQPQARPVTRRATRPGVQVHILQPGETLWSVARRYQTTVTNLMILNRLGEASSLAAGRELYVPATRGLAPTSQRAAKPKNRGAAVYEVKKGDSLWSISRRFGVTVNEILTWNNLTDLAHLPVGTKLAIKKPSQRQQKKTPTQKPKTPVRPRTPKPRVPQPTKVAKASGRSDFIWPLRGKLARTFGWYDGRPHTGIDINGRLGAPVRAAASGTVIYSAPMRGYGNVIILDHGDGFFSVYGNLLENLVRKGPPSRPRRVTRGLVIGKVGATVEGPTPHLHFEIRQKNKAINPLRYLPH